MQLAGLSSRIYWERLQHEPSFAAFSSKRTAPSLDGCMVTLASKFLGCQWCVLQRVCGISVPPPHAQETSDVSFEAHKRSFQNETKLVEVAPINQKQHKASPDQNQSQESFGRAAIWSHALQSGCLGGLCQGADSASFICNCCATPLEKNLLEYLVSKVSTRSRNVSIQVKR